MFDALTAACRREGYHGCAFINTAAESAPGGGVHARTVEHKAAVLVWVSRMAEAAGAVDPESLARGLTCCSTAASRRGCSTPIPARAKPPSRLRASSWTPGVPATTTPVDGKATT